MNRAGYHEYLTLPCHVQVGENGCTADEPIKKKKIDLLNRSMSMVSVMRSKSEPDVTLLCR